MNKWVMSRWVCWGALCGLILWGGCGSSTGGGKSDSATGSSTAGLPDGFSPQQDSGGGGECNPGQKSCEGNSRLQCGLDGYWSDPTPCPAGTVCSGGVCAPCQPGQKLCQGQMIVECSADGTSAVPAGTCPDQCYNGVCVNCTPGAKECRAGPDETQETWECVAVSAEAAEWQKTASCPEGTDCVQGLCINPCQSDIKLNTNQGCDYYALDLENSAEAGSSGATPANGQFAVIVSNPSALKTITVTVHETQKGDAIVTEAVGPGGLSIIPLGPRNITGTLQGEYAWRVKGTAPFVAYQFNPLDNVNPVYSNDASLLLPVNALGKDYMVMTASGGGPFLTVVGTASATEVTVTVTAATEAGPNIPALAAGETYTATIGAAEVLNLRAAELPDGSETLTGSTVTANRNIVVFGGNVAANMGGRCCADHLEQQMFPTSAWGTTFIATKAQPRNVESDHWRVLARDDGTQVTFSGGVANPVTLNRGQFVDVDTTVDFVITADKPILVGQFLASSFEVLALGDYCESNLDCPSGVCAGAGTGAGSCLNTCAGSTGSCSASEYCVDNELLDNSPGPGGTCLFRPCSGGLAPCPANATCAALSEISLCFDTCFGFGAACSNSTHQCNPDTPYGTVCLPGQCFSDFECNGGYCAILSDGSGECKRSCAPINECGAGSVCIPPGYVSDPTITTGVCTQQTCVDDSTCGPGHTCVMNPATGADGTCQVIGDPAFIVGVPAEQFRDDYVFLAPNAYKEDYVNIVAPVSATITLDNAAIPETAFTPIVTTEFKVARIALTDGPHRITGTAPFGIVVYGYHDDVSYGYPGGANLFDLGK